MTHHETIIIIDFGSQYTQLITRRIREANVYSEVHPYTINISAIENINLKGIILSGGPMSVYDDDAPELNPALLDLNVPILGICYGLQLLCLNYGGKVEKTKNREYGKAILHILTNNSLFKDVKNNSTVWMSHGDVLSELPDEFERIGESDNSPVCAITNKSKLAYGVQFHPEVVHTEEGAKIINNYLFNICDCKADWTPKNFIDEQIIKIKKNIGNDKAFCALSGGVDSTVAAILVKRAIGDNLISIHIDNGLMRKDESANIAKLFDDKLKLNPIYVDASEKFLSALKGITDPERKRKIIGKTFIQVFEEESNKIKNVKFLVQGTLYPDVIESVSVKGESATIKTHHNVGGLPDMIK